MMLSETPRDEDTESSYWESMFNGMIELIVFAIGITCKFKRFTIWVKNDTTMSGQSI